MSGSAPSPDSSDSPPSPNSSPPSPTASKLSDDKSSPPSPSAPSTPPPDQDSPPPSPPSSPPPKSNPPPSPPPSSPPPSTPSSPSTPPSPKTPEPSPPPPSSEKDSPPPKSNTTPPPDKTPSPPAEKSSPSPPPSPPSPDNKPTPSPPPPDGSGTPPNSETPPSPPPPVISTSPTNATAPSSPPSSGTVPPGSGSPSPPPSQASSHAPSLSTPSKSGTPTSKNSPPPSASGGVNSGTVVGVTVASVCVIALIAIFFIIARRRKKRGPYTSPYMPPPTAFSTKTDGFYYGQQSGMPHSGPADSFYSSQGPHSSISNSYGSQRGHMYLGGTPESGVLGGTKSFFSYEEVMEITNGFSRQNVLGEGGFGCVFKGWLPDGRVVAVKQLKAGSGQGEREFRAEVDIISRVHHRHLVSLVGYCISEQHRLLIYEFVPNKTLEHHLHAKDLPVLGWDKRVKIALGSAKGLAYLHEDCHPKIIHRDIKSANILLDDDFEAQVADFGLARLNDTTQTHVSTRVMGTFGYLAPEYASTGKLTDRSDVFSFGVVLLELITGRKPVDPTQPLGDESLVEWARPILIRAIETGNISELVDPRLEKHYVESEVFRMIEAAAACVRHSGPKRPRMVQVVRALDSDGEMSDLSNGVRYGQSTVYNSGQYNQDISKFRRMALGSDDSSEFDLYSGEYNSRDASGGTSNSWRYGNSSSELTSGESETRAINPQSGEHRYGGAPGNRRFV